MSKLAKGGFSIFKLVSVAEETGLSLALSEISKLEVHMLNINIRLQHALLIEYSVRLPTGA